MEPGQSGKEKTVTPHQGASSLRRGKQGGGAPQERGKVPPRADDQSGASWEAELRKGTREKDGQKGGEGDGRQLTSRDRYAHTLLSGVASIPPSVRFPSAFRTASAPAQLSNAVSTPVWTP